jgi:chemotaxis protein MotB
VKPGEEDTKAHELVIIRRRSGGEEGGHHGGVWKIAYADFMTAMMAFFLVMWLINSTDQKVLTQVANYFNPMRLTDNAPHERGVHNIESGEQGKPGKQNSTGDPKEKQHSKEKAREKAKDKNQDKTHDKATEKSAAVTGEGKDDKEGNGSGKARYTEQALFSDPYGVLARIAAEAPSESAATATAPADKSAPSAEVYRDPFDPAAQRDAKEKGPPGGKTAAAAPIGGKGEAGGPQDTDAGAGGAKEGKSAPAEASPDAKAAPQDGPDPAKDASPPADKASERASEALQNAAKQEAAQAAAQKAVVQDEAGRIESEIKRATSHLPGTLPNIDVTVTDDGVLISLTDDYDFGMFAIASAEPRPAMVVVMEKMAKVLQTQAQAQKLIVRGHTDGRPYRSGSYDNWRLSTARAHMAYYMLVRGGVDERRFEKIEGHADRNLRMPMDPGAAQNRRIEILLRRPTQ